MTQSQKNIKDNGDEVSLDKLVGIGSKNAQKSSNAENQEKISPRQRIYDALNTTAGIAAILYSTAESSIGGLVASASFPIGAKAESKLANTQFTKAKFRDEAIAGALFFKMVKEIQDFSKGYGLDGLVNGLDGKIPHPLIAASLTLAAIPLLNIVYYPVKHLTDKKTIKGLCKSFKESYAQGTWRALVYVGLPSSTVVGLSTAFPNSQFLEHLSYWVLAASQVVYRVISSEEKIDHRKSWHPLTYIPDPINRYYSADISLGNRFNRYISNLNLKIRKLFDGKKTLI